MAQLDKSPQLEPVHTLTLTSSELHAIKEALWIALGHNRPLSDRTREQMEQLVYLDEQPEWKRSRVTELLERIERQET